MRHRNKHRTPRLIGRSNVILNQCDGCQACCVVMGVEELHKLPGAKCIFQWEAGCFVHTSEIKPHCCEVYSCMWRNGVLGRDPDLRPDRCKVLFNVERSVWGPIPIVREVEPGVLKSVVNKEATNITANNPHGKAMLALFKMASRSLCLVIGEADRRLIGPRGLLEAASKVAKATIEARKGKV